MLRSTMLVVTLAAFVILTGPAQAGGIFNKWLSYETWDEFDWTYSANNPVGSTFAIDADSNLVTGSYGTPRMIWAEKRLERPICPGSDFVFESHVIVETDPDMGAGHVGIALLNDADVRVAGIAWFDWQAAPTYGDLEMSAELNTIYRSEPHGFSHEFPTPDHVFRIVRTGDIWTGWVDEKRGGSLELHPTMTITKIRVEFHGDTEPWIPRETKIDYIKVVNSPVFGDSDSSGGVDIDDVVYVIQYIFGGGPEPNANCP